jgi:hypothetical protein
MYRKQHNGQLSIEEFHVPFGGTLDPENRWVIFSSMMPLEELEATYALLFSPTTGARAKPVRLAFGALFIKQRLGLTDEETVEIRENAYMRFYLALPAIPVSHHLTHQRWFISVSDSQKKTSVGSTNLSLNAVKPW